jgi:hypothetical protein
MWLFSLVLLVQPPEGDALHSERNPIYREVLERGIAVTKADQHKLSPPYLADGLDADAQRKFIEELGGRRYPWESLTRKSTVAQQIIQITDETLPNTDTKARVAHVYFVAYGDFDAIAKAGGLSEPGNTDGRQWKPLSTDDLAAKKISVEDPDHESYGYFSNDLIEKVRLSGVLRTYWSRTEDSLVAAAMLDPRFDGDPDFPNRWQPLSRGRSGPVAGKASPYSGAGGYTKITKLHALDGAMFVESHLVFAEPEAWFNGANLLGSKLPAVLQHEVREARQEFLEAGKKSD